MPLLQNMHIRFFRQFLTAIRSGHSSQMSMGIYNSHAQGTQFIDLLSAYAEISLLRRFYVVWTLRARVTAF